MERNPENRQEGNSTYLGQAGVQMRLFSQRGKIMSGE